MFDDDLSYLESFARTLRSYPIVVVHVDERTLLAIYKEPTEHFVGLIRKKRNIPFYQAFVAQFYPSDTNYTGLGTGNKLVEFVFANPDKVRAFSTADVSGHENFETEFLRVLKETIK